MADPDFTIRSIGGHWHLVIVERGVKTTFPAASETGAGIMLRMEQRRRGILKDGGPGMPRENPASRS